MKKARRIIVIDGEEHEISLPPEPEDWRVIDAYLRNLSAFNRRLLRSVVALEKKVHWDVPTSPHWRKRMCDCRREDEPEGHDPLTDDEGDPDKGGSGGDPGDWGPSGGD